MLGVCTLAACQTSQPPSNPNVIRDQARVLQVDPLLGQALLDLHGKRVWAYWQTQTSTARDGTIAGGGLLRPPVGDYRQAVTREVTFPAKAGDTISFVGMRTGEEIFLRGVAVVGR